MDFALTRYLQNKATIEKTVQWEIVLPKLHSYVILCSVITLPLFNIYFHFLKWGCQNSCVHIHVNDSLVNHSQTLPQSIFYSYICIGKVAVSVESSIIEFTNIFAKIRESDLPLLVTMSPLNTQLSQALYIETLIHKSRFYPF